MILAAADIEQAAAHREADQAGADLVVGREQRHPGDHRLRDNELCRQEDLVERVAEERAIEITLDS